MSTSNQRTEGVLDSGRPERGSTGPAESLISVRGRPIGVVDGTG